MAELLARMPNQTHLHHDVLDALLEDVAKRCGWVREADPGRSAPPVVRIASVRERALAEEDGFIAQLAGKAILVAGEFAPHRIERLLVGRSLSIVQLHPRTPHGGLPPHFTHLAGVGLRGVVDMADLVNETFGVVLFEGFTTADAVWASPLVSLALRLYPESTAIMVATDRQHPHMTAQVNVAAVVAPVIA